VSLFEEKKDSPNRAPFFCNYLNLNEIIENKKACKSYDLQAVIGI
tara:strand:- start:365 stop:499 length:135 start_codon:yes stop_codon:yes gene_type:complete